MATHAMRPRRRAEAGFTMVEVMIALLLTAVAIMGILALFMTATKSTDYSRHTTEATVLAQDRVEWLRTQGAAAAYGPITETGIDERGVVPGLFTRTSSEVVGTDFATIKVTVTWVDGGASHTVTLNARRNL
jgi:type IV pilus modification protein PilV